MSFPITAFVECLTSEDGGTAGTVAWRGNLRSMGSEARRKARRTQQPAGAETMNATTKPGPLEVRLSGLLGMRVGVRYVVTRGSKNREFQVGDRVWLEDDGSIMCPAAHGWMPPEDVVEAAEGWAIEPDANWAAAMRADLERKLAALPPGQSLCRASMPGRWRTLECRSFGAPRCGYGLVGSQRLRCLSSSPLAFCACTKTASRVLLTRGPGVRAPNAC
jgi:hypothetical protein